MRAAVVQLFPWPQLSEGNFGAFWQLYPRRVCKIDAQRAWARLTPQERIEALRALPRHVDQWTQLEQRAKWHMPHAATWINGKRWLDELDAVEDLGQCEWNKNGNRDAATGRCEQRARYTRDGGNVYCSQHAASLGMTRKKP